MALTPFEGAMPAGDAVVRGYQSLQGQLTTLSPRYRPPVEFSVVPSDIRADTDQHQGVKQCYEYQGYIWAMYWSNSVGGQPVILARRAVGSGTWTEFQMSGNVLGTLRTVAQVNTDVDTGTETITITGHGFIVGEAVLYNTGTGSITATGLANGTVLFIKSATTDTFTVSLTEGGTTLNLTGVSAGTVKFTPTAPVLNSATDYHYTLHFAFDSKGRIHCWGKHHDQRMHYWYCDVSDSGFATASNWHTVQTMVLATDEDSVTYPQPLQYDNRKLQLGFRDGTSGNGDYLLYEHDPNSNTWMKRATLFGHGSGTTYNAYPIFHEDENGRQHVVWSWASTDVFNICYAYSDDGVSWYKSTGERYVLPIESSSAENVAVIATGTYLSPSGGMWVNDGVVHIIGRKYDGSTGTQFYYIRSLGSGLWSTPAALTSWTYLYDTTASPPNHRISDARLVRSRAGRMVVVYRNQNTARGFLMGMDITDAVDSLGNVTKSEIVHFPFVALDCFQMTPQQFHERNIRYQDKIQWFIAACTADYSGSAEEYVNGALWNTQAGVQVTIDLSQLHELSSRRCKIPGIRILERSNSVKAATQNITATSTPGDLIEMCSLTPNTYDRANLGDLYVNRYMTRVAIVGLQNTSGTFTARINRNRIGTTDIEFDILTITSATEVMVKTPWFPLYGTASPPTIDQNWFVGLHGRVSANSADIQASRLEVGVFDYV